MNLQDLVSYEIFYNILRYFYDILDDFLQVLESSHAQVASETSLRGCLRKLLMEHGESLPVCDIKKLFRDSV